LYRVLVVNLVLWLSTSNLRTLVCSLLSISSLGSLAITKRVPLVLNKSLVALADLAGLVNVSADI